MGTWTVGVGCGEKWRPSPLFTGCWAEALEGREELEAETDTRIFSLKPHNQLVTPFPKSFSEAVSSQPFLCMVALESHITYSAFDQHSTLQKDPEGHDHYGPGGQVASAAEEIKTTRSKKH